MSTVYTCPFGCPVASWGRVRPAWSGQHRARVPAGTEGGFGGLL